MQNIQVDKNHYKSSDYDNLKRFISYYGQKESVQELAARFPEPKILEIGKGNGFLCNYLAKHGLAIKTFDYAADLAPDYLGDIENIENIVKEKFDIVCAFEILEHIKYDHLDNVLRQLEALTNKYLVLSVPQSGFRLSIFLEISHYLTIGKFFQFPAIREHCFDGEHYWELARPGFGVGQFRSLLSKHFKINKEYTEPLDSYHRYYILEKI